MEVIYHKIEERKAKNIKIKKNKIFTVTLVERLFKIWGFIKSNK